MNRVVARSTSATSGIAARRSQQPRLAGFARILAAVTLAVATAGLAAQVVITATAFAADGKPAAAGVWRLAGYFTIWSNVLVTLAAAAALRGARLRRGRIVVLPAILVTGAVYTLLLRPLIHDPEPVQAAVSSLLHDVTPLMFLALVAAMPAGRPRWSSAALAAAVPAAYLVAAVTRGVLTGWFPYWFLDPAEVGALGILRSAILLAASFSVLGGVVVALERWRS